MLGFIIPLKEKAKSTNWPKDNLLLKNTLTSICNQKSNSYKIFVIYTDIPDIVSHDKIEYVKYPFPFLEASEMTDYEEVVKKQFPDVIGERIFDQGKRILYGCKIAKERGCGFVMSVDADDLVSNKISSFVEQNCNEKLGFFVNKGYILAEKKRLLIKVPANMNHINGSTHIVHIDLIPSINFHTKRLSDVTFFSAHGYLKSRILHEFHDTLKPLPFYALIYLVHNSNWSDYRGLLKKQWLKTLIKYVFRSKLLNRSLKQEFAIFDK